MSQRRPHTPVVTGPPSVADLQAQADGFRNRAGDIRRRLEALTAESDEFHRGPGVSTRILKLKDDLQAAEQGRRNAERVLMTAMSIAGYDDAVRVGTVDGWVGPLKDSEE